MRLFLFRMLLITLALIFSLITALVLFISAGRWDLPMFWVVVVVMGCQNFIAMFLMDPGLLRERIKYGTGGRDKFTLYAGKLLMTAVLVIAGLDVGRYHWSDSVPMFLQIIGLIIFTLAFSVTFWSMVMNPYFSPVVRIQQERGHHLITDGPYRFIRHPGYAGIVISMPCLSLALGSWISLLLVVVINLLILRRLQIEDRFLHEKLEGYTAYAERVRYRIIPGVW